jgi:hypothetical protein
MCAVIVGTSNGWIRVWSLWQEPAQKEEKPAPFRSTLLYECQAHTGGGVGTLSAESNNIGAWCDGEHVDVLGGQISASDREHEVAHAIGNNSATAHSHLFCSISLDGYHRGVNVFQMTVDTQAHSGGPFGGSAGADAGGGNGSCSDAPTAAIVVEPLFRFRSLGPPSRVLEIEWRIRDMLLLVHCADEFVRVCSLTTGELQRLLPLGATNFGRSRGYHDEVPEHFDGKPVQLLPSYHSLRSLEHEAVRGYSSGAATSSNASPKLPQVLLLSPHAITADLQRLLSEHESRLNLNHNEGGSSGSLGGGIQGGTEGGTGGGTGGGNGTSFLQPTALGIPSSTTAATAAMPVATPSARRVDELPAVGSSRLALAMLSYLLPWGLNQQLDRSVARYLCSPPMNHVNKAASSISSGAGAASEAHTTTCYGMCGAGASLTLLFPRASSLENVFGIRYCAALCAHSLSVLGLLCSCSALALSLSRPTHLHLSRPTHLHFPFLPVATSVLLSCSP